MFRHGLRRGTHVRRERGFPSPRRHGIVFAMNQNRLPFGAAVFFVLMLLLGLYFAFAAVQGPSGILRRVQLEAETAELLADRDRLQAEVDSMANLTRRLSDDYLDLDLLDERAREVLGMVRADEAVIR